MATEAASPSKPKYDPVPTGYIIVTEGEIRKDDWVWDDSDYEWAQAGKDEIGDDASVYFGVARKS